MPQSVDTECGPTEDKRTRFDMEPLPCGDANLGMATESHLIFRSSQLFINVRQMSKQFFSKHRGLVSKYPGCENGTYGTKENGGFCVRALGSKAKFTRSLKSMQSRLSNFELTLSCFYCILCFI